MAKPQQLANGACGFSDGSKAGQWRVPNVWERERVVDESSSAPALTEGNPVIQVATGGYWTSTSIFQCPTSAPNGWAVDFTTGQLTTGQYVNDGTTNVKTSPLAVPAVKGASGGRVTV